jgi:hypothetical protein
MTSPKLTQTREEVKNITASLKRLATQLSEQDLLTDGRVSIFNLNLLIATTINTFLDNDPAQDDEFWTMIEVYLESLRRNILHFRQVLNPQCFDKGDHL